MLKVADAKKLCDFGLVWGSQIFRCEPFAPEVRPSQCFKCQEWGHKAKFCKKAEKCARCAGNAHEEGEKACPHYANKAKWKCINCSGHHTSFDRRACPVAMQQRDRASVAYSHRALTFEDKSEALKSHPVPFFHGNGPDAHYTTTVAMKKRKVRDAAPHGAGPAQTGQGPLTNFLTRQRSSSSMPPMSSAPQLNTTLNLSNAANNPENRSC